MYENKGQEMAELSKEDIGLLVNFLGEMKPEIETGDWESVFHMLKTRIINSYYSPNSFEWLREFLEDVRIDVIAESGSVPPYYYFHDISFGKNKSYTVPKQVTKIGESAYIKSAIKKLYIGSNVSSIEERAFYGCYDLESVTIEEGVQPISIQDKAFYSCQSLKNVVIKKPVQYIGQYAFNPGKGGSGLEYVYIKEFLPSVSMGTGTFVGRHLKMIEYGGTMRDWDSVVKDKNAIQSWEKVIIKCSDGELDNDSL